MQKVPYKQPFKEKNFVYLIMKIKSFSKNRLGYVAALWLGCFLATHFLNLFLVRVKANFQINIATFVDVTFISFIALGAATIVIIKALIYNVLKSSEK